MPDRRHELDEDAARLLATFGQLVRRIKQTRAPGDLTLAESSALGRLRRHGPVSAAELAKLEQISPQSMGVTLGALVAKGLVERAPDPADGRRMILTLTEAGADTVDVRRQVRAEQVTRALAELSAAERAQLLAVLPILDRVAESL